MRTRHSEQQQQQHGSHFSRKKQKVESDGEEDEDKRKSSGINDEWATCLESWQEIAPYLTKFKELCVWQPFYYDGKCAEHLKEIGFKNVIHQDVDFFKRAADKKFLDKVDLVWDNPPYTGQEIKEKVISELFDIGKPFVLLLPSSILFTKILRDCVANAAKLNQTTPEIEFSKIQVIFPRKIMVSKTGKNPVPFKQLVWLCYNVQLPRDLILLS
jgi:hypothetical protein